VAGTPIAQSKEEQQLRCVRRAQPALEAYPYDVHDDQPATEAIQQNADGEPKHDARADDRPPAHRSLPRRPRCAALRDWWREDEAGAEENEERCEGEVE